MPNITAKKLIKNCKGKLICVDIDETLGKGNFLFDLELKPIKRMIKFVTELHEHGAHIIIWTARQEKYYPETKAWLIKYRVPFVAIAMRHKPQADYYIDDKAINPKSIK